MVEEKSLLTRIGDAVEAARDKAQEMGASLVKKAEGVAAEAKREAGKARTLVARKTRAATASEVVATAHAWKHWCSTTICPLISSFSSNSVMAFTPVLIHN